MAQDRQDQDLMDYEAMTQEALRGVVKAALKRAAAPGGMPGAHHFYITFRTRAAGVSAPSDLTDAYPDEMTIVLQHQYWDLAPGETFFTVMLQFGGQPKRLSVPYAAVSRFYDPSVQFLLQFEGAVEGAADAPTGAAPTAVLEKLPTRPRLAPDPTAAVLEEQAEADAPKIVSLDQFRKK